MTHFLIREKQPDFNNIQEGAVHLHARIVSAVTLHLWEEGSSLTNWLLGAKTPHSNYPNVYLLP